MSNHKIKLLPFHPLADKFPRMEGKELNDLVGDIRWNGQRQPIDVYEGKIIDGITRALVCYRLGIEPKYNVIPAGAFSKPGSLEAYIASQNIHRRHLTAEQKRKIIAELLKANPEKSDRQHAKTAKVSPTHMGKVRKQLEKSGEVSTVDTRTDAKGVKQPAGKPAKPSHSPGPAPKPAAPPPLPLVPSPKSALAEPNESDRCEHLRAQKDELFERFHDFAEELDQDAAQRLRGLVNQADAIFEQVLAVWQPERREQEALPSAPMPNNEPPTDVKNDNEDDPFAFPPSLKREPPADLNAELGRLNAKAKNAARSN